MEDGWDKLSTETAEEFCRPSFARCLYFIEREEQVEENQSTNKSIDQVRMLVAYQWNLQIRELPLMFFN
jgi:hypothetical protein